MSTPNYVIQGRTFVIKTVYPVNTRTFMVASENEEIFRVFDLVSEKEANGLQRLLPSVNVVAQEEIIGFRRKPAVLKESQKVVILAMNIA